MSRSTAIASGAALLIMLNAGCNKAQTAANSTPTEATAIADHQCAACGMTVRDQPAPRAQLIRADGTREFLCSIGDLLSYLDEPSPHGQATAVFVEQLDPTAAPSDLDPTPRPWRKAEEAGFVIDVERRVMGKPVLVYATPAEATMVAQQHSARAVLWHELRRADHATH